MKTPIDILAIILVIMSTVHFFPYLTGLLHHGTRRTIVHASCQLNISIWSSRCCSGTRLLGSVPSRSVFLSSMVLLLPVMSVLSLSLVGADSGGWKQ
jgi:hypothetical protein